MFRIPEVRTEVDGQLIKYRGTLLPNHRLLQTKLLRRNYQNVNRKELEKLLLQIEAESNQIIFRCCFFDALVLLGSSPVVRISIANFGA